MSRKKLNRKKIIIFSVCMVFLIFLGFFTYNHVWILFDIIIPAISSVSTVCNVNSTSLDDYQDYANQKGFVIQGVYDPVDDSITIVQDYIESQEEYDTVLRHEKCHRMQNLQNRSYGCYYTKTGSKIKINTKLFLFFNEVEAYMAQGDPDYTC